MNFRMLKEQLSRPGAPVCLLLAGGLLLWALLHLGWRIAYEAGGPYTWDTTIYWAVGRGVLNGLTPWRDLFETKPAGIFMLSAASFALGGVYLNHLFQILALAIVALFPLLTFGRRGFGWQGRDGLVLFVLLLGGLLLALYVAERSGEVQVESFGAAGAALAVWAMHGRAFASRPRARLVIGALGWMLALGMKEPFLFSLAGAGLLLLETPKAWLQRFCAPLALAALCGMLLLLLLGWLGAYFSDYLGYMLHYAGRGGSPWQRAFHVWRIWDDMNGFARGLGYLLLALAMSWLLLQTARARDHYGYLQAAIRLGLAFWLASLAVGLGGEYYNHHHVFAVPVFMALLAATLPALSAVRDRLVWRLAWLAVIGAAAWAVLSLPNLNFPARQAHLTEKADRARAEAQYVDAVLDKQNLQRYLYVGFNGPQLFAYTRHSPYGPMFFQLQDFIDHAPRFRDSYFAALAQTDLVVLNELAPGLREQTLAILNRDFSTTPWPEVAALPRPNPMYQIWYRKH